MVLSNVHIGNSIFKIDDDAKIILDSYRNALFEHLKSFNNSTIIIKEIEYKLSELLLPYIDNEFDFLTEDNVKQAILIIGLPDGYSISDLTDDTTLHVNASIYNETVLSISEKLKTLYRDIDRQQIGGVAAGVADSLKTDPLWIRLILVLPLFFLGSTKIPLLITSLLYLTGWLLLPEKRNIHRDDKTRIFFRDKESKILGGVASGLSNYLNIDLNWIRLGLIISSYFVNEIILLYIVIWIVTPFSRSLKDKFQSKGLQFNLEEIESYLNKTFENTNFSTEYINTIYSKIDKKKININPFLFKVAKGLSFILGALLFTVTISLVFAAIPLLGVSLKIIPLHSIFNYISNDFANEVLLDNDFNLLNTIQYSIPNTTAVITALHFTTLSTFLFIVSTSLMSFKKSVNNSILLGLFVSNIVFSILLLTALNMSVHNFDNQATHKEEVVLPLNDEALNLKMDVIGNLPLNESKIFIKGYQGEKLKLVFMQEALGKTREKAIINAKAIDYPSKIVLDNTITLSSHFSLPRGVKYRMQSMKLFIYIPQGQFFTIDHRLKAKVEDQDIEFKDYTRDNFLVFDNNDICHSINKEEAYTLQNNITHSNTLNSQLHSQHIVHSSTDTDENMLVTLEKLDTLQLYGNLDIKINVVENYSNTSVLIKESSDYKIKSINGILKIYPINEESEEINKLNISVPPSLAKIKFNGKGEFILNDHFSDSLQCDLSGNINAKINLDTDYFFTNVEGVSLVEINGKSEKAFVLANDGSQINGENFITQEVKAKAKGVSKIVITAKQNATIFQSPLSKVTILGDPLHYEKHTQR